MNGGYCFQDIAIRRLNAFAIRLGRITFYGKKKKGFLHFLKEIDNHQIQSCQIKCVSWYQTASTWGRPNVAVYDGSK